VLQGGFNGIESRTGVVAGLVPATSHLRARSNNDRDGRDKPGHDDFVAQKVFSPNRPGALFYCQAE
jgi:hypothetical protein